MLSSHSRRSGSFVAFLLYHRGKDSDSTSPRTEGFASERGTSVLRDASNFCLRREMLGQWRFLRLLQKLHMLERPTEHGAAVAAKPLIEQGGVHAAEIGVMLQISRIKILQARMPADRTAL